MNHALGLLLAFSLAVPRIGHTSVDSGEPTPQAGETSEMPPYTHRVDVLLGMTMGTTLGAEVGFGPGLLLGFQAPAGRYVEVGSRLEVASLLTAALWDGQPQGAARMSMPWQLTIDVSPLGQAPPARPLIGAVLGPCPTLEVSESGDLDDLAAPLDVGGHLAFTTRGFRIGATVYLVRPARVFFPKVPRSFASVAVSLVL